MDLTEDEMWIGVIECNKNYDGKFYYAVGTTHIYCRPSCTSRTPLRRNIVYFKTRGEAEMAGYRPCKRCQPEMLDKASETKRGLINVCINGQYNFAEAKRDNAKRFRYRID